MATLKIDGMHCASCVGRVEKALLAVPQVGSVSVNLVTGVAEIKGKTPDSLTDYSPLIAALERVGYEAKSMDDKKKASPVN